MEFRLLNEILENFQRPGNNKALKFIQKEYTHKGVSGSSYNYDGVQGEEDRYYEIYECVNIPDTFIKIEFYTDSYGDNDAVRSVQFV